ncbi:uncharacterized protein LOC141618828 [Silene latifolia]|uniref:uncharacterized protein LOC141618828 n=1 Tax=Silene latifolia TaxID=37657 RepID=UPI003D773ACF
MNNQRVGLFALLETKISGGNVGNISLNLFDGWSVTTNNHTHKGGRVWLLWQPQLFDRVDLWRWLKDFAHTCNDPWALAGDFNTVLSPTERLGGQTRDNDMDDFLDCVTACGMIDIQATGAFFTWTNEQDAEHRKYSRLDRFLVNSAWLTEYPDMVGHFHPEGLFDHNPCVVSNRNLGVTRNKSFKYFNMWGQASTFISRVNEVWDKNINGTKMFCIVKKLKGLKDVLKELNKECYSDIELKTGEAEAVLAAIQTRRIDPMNPSVINQEKEAMGKLGN